METSSPTLATMRLPALAIAGGAAIVAGADGAARTLGASEARELFASGEVLVCHALFVAARLQAKPLRPLYDVLELFHFVRPGLPCLPSPLGLARALQLPEPASPHDSAHVLHQAARILLDELTTLSPEGKDAARMTGAAMARAGWHWGP